MFPKVSLALALFSVLFISTIATGAVPGPTVPPSPTQLVPTLMLSSMTPMNQNATVTASSGSSVTFDFKVTVTKPPLITITVKLTGRCAASFPMTVTPDSITFTQPETVQAKATVVVPARSWATNGIRVTVDGVATWPGGSVTASTQGSLNVLQYHGVKATVDTLIGKGNPQELQVHIQNMGNGNDTFVLEVANKADLDKDGIRFEFSQTQVEQLRPDANATVKLKVSYGLSTPSGKKEVRVRISSINVTQGSAQAGAIEVSVYVDVGALGGGGSETYIVVGLIVLIIIIAIVLLFWYRKKAREKGATGRVIKLTEKPKVPSKAKDEKVPDGKDKEKKDVEKKKDEVAEKKDK